MVRRGSLLIVNDSFRQVIATLGRVCRELTKEVVSLEIELLIEENGPTNYLIVYTDGSVHMSDWGYTVSLFGEIAREDSGYVQLTTSSMCMEVKAISEMFDWVRYQTITRIVSWLTL